MLRTYTVAVDSEWKHLAAFALGLKISFSMYGLFLDFGFFAVRDAQISSSGMYLLHPKSTYKSRNTIFS